MNGRGRSVRGRRNSGAARVRCPRLCVGMPSLALFNLCLLVASLLVLGADCAQAQSRSDQAKPEDRGATSKDRGAPPPSSILNSPSSASSPSGSDVPVLPIDLPTTLRLVAANNPTIALARERINEALAQLRLAQVLFLPNLQTGPAYVRHDGILQNASGLVFPVSKWNFFEGGGASLFVETSDALFAPRIARRLLDAQTAGAQGVANKIQLDAASRYLDLLVAYGALAVNAETLDHAQRAAR